MWNVMRSFHVGRILGVDVRIHPTFLLVFGLTWLLWGRGPQGSWLSFLLGCLLVFIVFFSVLAHELAHCMVARECGIPVLDVSISPLAGVSRIEQIPASARTEFLIALAGPAANLAIFMLLLPFVALLGVVLGPEGLFGSGEWFQRLSPTAILTAAAALNLGLMLFNLLPAFPLDGGRLVRAYLSARMGRRKATVMASRIGIGIAVLLILVGVWQRDWWLPALGLFILYAGWTEARVVRIEDQMQTLRVGSYALWDSGGIAPDVPLSYALRGGPRDMVVTQRGRVVGMLWRKNLLAGLEGGISGRLVRDVAVPAPYIADVADSLWDVQLRMSAEQTSAIPVVEKGRYRGIFTADRFIGVYRQMAPGLRDREWELSDEWRDAVMSNLRRPRRRT